MKQPTLEQRKEYMDIVDDAVTIVPIKGTKRTVRIRWIKPYTMERITKIWIERDLASARLESGADVLKDLAKEPYFAFKEAALMVLNHDIKIRLLYGLYWRWLAHKFNEEQILDIVAVGKKKLPLSAHYGILAYSLDMRTDWVTMTKKEAERYRAELLLEEKRLSSKISQSTDGHAGGSSAGSGISATDAS